METGTTLILALGNPSAEYEDTYHNAGLLALPQIFLTLTGGDFESLEWKTHKKLFEYAESSRLSSRVSRFIFARPLVYMNESGLAAAEAMKKFNIKPENLVVVHDDSDITLGEFKLSFDRSSGGQKGAQSIIDHIKTQAFRRVRIGIRPAKESKRQKAGDFVLKKITLTSMKVLEKVFIKAAAELANSLLP